jgi:integrase
MKLARFRKRERGQLTGMPAGDSLLDLRDRAILKFYLYTGARIETGCKLNVSDFHQEGDEATLRFQLKGARAKTKGIRFGAAEAITEYFKAAGIVSGRLFRPRRSRRDNALSTRRMTQRSMYRLLMSYLARRPGALQEKELPSGENVQECIYSPHSLRATTATLLLDTSVPIESCSTTSTSPPLRFMISGGARCAIPPRIKCRSRVPVSAARPAVKRS